ncbi:uncharacterized protein [Chironomus tepperi]|uniref:uncharacterized protein n=1 Tax=Chironomus tepperi TaxID=113505 RepID=UPI00391F58A8
MKKGLLQRASKNWEEEMKLANLPMDIKEEPILESIDLRKSVLQSESSKMSSTSSSKSDNENIPVTSMRHQRRVQSMISVRKDYSYKYTSNNKSKAPITSSQEKSFNCLDISQKVSQSSFGEQNQNAKRELGNATPGSNKQHMSSHKGLIKRKEHPNRRSIKPNISILERHDYDKGPAKVMKIEKLVKTDDEDEDEDIDTNSSCSAIEDNTIKSPLPLKLENLKELTVPIERLNIDGNYKKSCEEKSERDELKVIVAHEEIETTPSTTVVKQEQSSSPEASASLRQPTLSTESKDSQNINKINNKINIIFQLNDNTKRKNIILHRRTPKKMVQKITIKEANNNSPKSQSDEATLVPDKILCTKFSQTEEVLQKRFSMNMSMTNPLTDEITEYLFFENDILISLQSNTISFFEYHRLNSLLKKGEPDFRLIDRINRRLHDIQVDSDNKYQRLCYNDSNSLPIYLEMRAKQKDLDDPEMCPIAFLYCNIYYIDQKRTKFSSVHLDTVKSIVHDIKYTTVPHSSYFIMSWHEKSTDIKSNITGIVKYKLTPNLDLAKLASIRQFPKLSYQIKQMYCAKDSQLITLGDTQVSIFNYDHGDLLISWDLMKNYGINLATITFEENYFFMVYLTDGDDLSPRKLIVIGIHRHDSNSLKVIQTLPVKIGHYEKLVSRSVTSTNHLIASFSSGSSLMMYLENFTDVHLKRSASDTTLIALNDHILTTSDDNISNVGLCHFTEFFLNN